MFSTINISAPINIKTKTQDDLRSNFTKSHNNPNISNTGLSQSYPPSNKITDNHFNFLEDIPKKNMVDDLKESNITHNHINDCFKDNNEIKKEDKQKYKINKEKIFEENKEKKKTFNYYRNSFPRTIPKNRFFRNTYFSSLNKDNTKGRKIRKCAYLLAIVNKDFFLNLGAEIIDDDLYLLKRKYSGTVKGETCAIMGITKKYFLQLTNSDSKIYSILRINEKLSDILGIEHLRAYRLEPLEFLFKYIDNISENELIIFNIEPKGSDLNVNIYPTANVCAPGGGMEKSDLNCYEMCARREFEEETQIKLPCYLNYIARQKFNLNDRICVYFIIRIS